MLQVHFLERITDYGSTKLLMIITNHTLHGRTLNESIELFGTCGFDDGETYDFHFVVPKGETNAWLQCSRYGDDLIEMRPTDVDNINELAFTTEILIGDLLIN